MFVDLNSPVPVLAGMAGVSLGCLALVYHTPQATPPLIISSSCMLSTMVMAGRETNDLTFWGSFGMIPVVGYLTYRGLGHIVRRLVEKKE